MPIFPANARLASAPGPPSQASPRLVFLGCWRGWQRSRPPRYSAVSHETVRPLEGSRCLGEELPSQIRPGNEKGRKHERDAESRQTRIDRGLHALEALAAKLAGPRARLRTRLAVEQAAQAALASAGAERWITFEVTERTEESYRQEKRGRPGQQTRYRKQTKTRFALSFSVDAAKVDYDARTDGCFPLITNDRELGDAEVLGAYRYQPNLEKRHHELKSVLGAAPVTLKSASRIEGLACCEFIALLCRCLIERELRRP